MSRRHEQPGDAGTDSFLDILANLVGILVILVVVVLIRVKQTVREQPAEPPLTAMPSLEVDLESLPLDVDFAVPRPVQTPAPNVSTSLVDEIRKLETELSDAANALTNVPEVPRSSDEGATDRLKLESDEARRQTAELIELTTARATDLARLERAVGRVVKELEELEDPPPNVESIKHEVRSLARLASTQQIYLHLEAGKLTVLPSEPLIKMALRHQRTTLRTPRFDGVYSGRVGPVDGVTLNYEARRAGTSAMDELWKGREASLATASQFWFEVLPEAESVPIEEAVSSGSAFRRMLATAPAAASLSCVVKPDSYAEARRLQEFMQGRVQRLAFLPTAARVPAMFSPGGTRVMTQ